MLLPVEPPIPLAWRLAPRSETVSSYLRHEVITYAVRHSTIARDTDHVRGVERSDKNESWYFSPLLQYTRAYRRRSDTYLAPPNFNAPNEVQDVEESLLEPRRRKPFEATAGTSERGEEDRSALPGPGLARCTHDSNSPSQPRR